MSNALAAQDAGELWTPFLKRLRATLGDDLYNSWFAKMEFESCQDGILRLSVPTLFLKSWITSHYLDQILDCWQARDQTVHKIEIIQRSCVLKVIAKPSPKASAKGDGTGKQYVDEAGRRLVHPTSTEPAHEGLTSSPLDERFTFESFVEDRSNALALAAAKQVSSKKKGDTMFNPLYIHGGVGLGKTHLLQAIVQASDASSGRKSLYLTAEKFMYSFVSAMRRQSTFAFKEALRDIGVLVIDDLQFMQGRASQAEFSHTINALMDSGHQMVIGCDRPISELESFDDRVKSRLGGGLVVEVGRLTEELRLDILKMRIKTAQERYPNFDIPLPVVSYIAKMITHNGRDLVGSVNRLLAQNQLTQHPITLAMAEREIRDLIRPQEPKRIKIEDIQRVVARRYNVSRSDMLSSRRTANVVRPRQVAMYLSKTLTLRSLPEIGRRFGGRDHTTVLHAVRKIEGLVGSDVAFAEEIEDLRRQLQE
jgi:chromosomal replication initiator protein